MLLDFLQKNHLKVISATINVINHSTQYGDSAFDPYHYCLNILLERYIEFLTSNNAIGYVVAEKRGQKEDLDLEHSFNEFYHHGTGYLKADKIKPNIIPYLIMRTKNDRVAGLEIADMSAKVMLLYTLDKYSINITGQPSNYITKFNKEIVNSLSSKIIKNTIIIKRSIHDL